MDWNSCTPNGVATLSCVPSFAANIIFWLLSFSGAVALILIIIGGIRLIVSGGDAKKIDQSRKTIIYAILGLILVMVSFLIVNTIGTITGITCFKDFTFTSCQ